LVLLGNRNRFSNHHRCDLCFFPCVRQRKQQMSLEVIEGRFMQLNESQYCPEEYLFGCVLAGTGPHESKLDELRDDLPKLGKEWEPLHEKVKIVIRWCISKNKRKWSHYFAFQRQVFSSWEFNINAAEQSLKSQSFGELSAFVKLTQTLITFIAKARAAKASAIYWLYGII